MGVYTEAIQKLYVSYFNRPADFAGLAFWEPIVTAANGDTTAVAKAFASSAEYTETFAGMDNLHIVAKVYQNLFNNSTPDLAGLQFWTNALNTGAMTIDNVVTEIAKGAQNDDLKVYDNKVAAAAAFTAALDTPSEALGYSGTAANNAAKAWMNTVTADADKTAAAITPAAINATIAGVVDAANQSAGQTFTLTAGLDNFVGTAGNDVFNVYAFNPATGAAATNLSAFDSIDGGAGKDTLNLDLTGGSNTVTGTINNVETINVTGAAAAVDASVFQGATNVNLSFVDGAEATGVTKLAAGTVAGFDASAGNITVGAAGASANVALTKVAETSSITVTGNTLSSVTVSGTRVDSDDNGSVAAQVVKITAGKNVQTVTLTTNQSSTVTLTENGATDAAKQITAFDASASTGKITITGDADLASIKTGSANDTVTVAAATAAAAADGSTAAKNASVSTGAGNDTITVNFAAESTGLTSVDAGAGNDKITINKLAGATVSVQGGEGDDVITVNGVLSTSDVVNGGAGTDTIALAGAAARTADDYIVFNKLVTGFESIKFTGATAEGALDASLLASTYTTIDLNAGGIVTGVGSQSIIGNGDVTVSASGYKAATSTAAATYAGTVAVTEKVSGTVTANADVVNLTVKAGFTDVAATLAGDARTANITLTNGANADGDADTFASVTVNTSATVEKNLASLTLTGNGSATVNNMGGKLVNVDASALGGTIALGDNAGDVTGGLTYASSNAAVETIKLGSGMDHVTIGASMYGAVDIVTGLHLVANTAGSDLAAGSDVLTVTAITGAAAKFTTTQTDLDLALKDAAASSKGDNLVFQLGGDTYVFHDAGTLGSIDAADTVVKLTGTIDLDALILSLAHGTAPAPTSLI